MFIKNFEFNYRQNDGITEKIKLIKKSRNIRHLFLSLKGLRSMIVSQKNKGRDIARAWRSSSENNCYQIKVAMRSSLLSIKTKKFRNI